MKNKLRNNIFSLTILEAVNYIIPLITIPYLFRTLGAETYGIVAFSQAVMQYFILFTEYGFNLSVTRQIAQSKNNKLQLQEIFSSALTVRILLVLVSMVVLPCLFLFNQFNGLISFYVISFISVIGNAMFPIWFFQGIEKMKYITVITVITRVVSTLLIFVCVKDSNDYITWAIINSSSFMATGLIGLLVVIFIFNIKFKLPKMKEVTFQLKEGWDVFLSIISTSLYTSSSVIILGILSSNTVVGYFSAIEKIVNALKRLQKPVTQALFPHVSNVVKENKGKAFSLVIKSGVIICTIMLLCSLSVFILSDLVLTVMLGENNSTLRFILQIMIWIPFIVTASTMLGSQTLLTFNLKKAFSTSILIPSLLHIPISFIMVSAVGVIGASVSILFTELFIMIYRLIAVSNYYKKGHFSEKELV